MGDCVGCYVCISTTRHCGNLNYFSMTKIEQITKPPRETDVIRTIVDALCLITAVVSQPHPRGPRPPRIDRWLVKYTHNITFYIHYYT